MGKHSWHSTWGPSRLVLGGVLVLVIERLSFVRSMVAYENAVTYQFNWVTYLGGSLIAGLGGAFIGGAGWASVTTGALLVLLSLVNLHDTKILLAVLSGALLIAATGAPIRRTPLTPRGNQLGDESKTKRVGSREAMPAILVTVLVTVGMAIAPVRDYFFPFTFFGGLLAVSLIDWHGRRFALPHRDTTWYTIAAVLVVGLVPLWVKVGNAMMFSRAYDWLLVGLIGLYGLICPEERQAAMWKQTWIVGLVVALSCIFLFANLVAADLYFLFEMYGWTWLGWAGTLGIVLRGALGFIIATLLWWTRRWMVMGLRKWQGRPL